MCSVIFPVQIFLLPRGKISLCLLSLVSFPDYSFCVHKNSLGTRLPFYITTYTILQKDSYAMYRYNIYNR